MRRGKGYLILYSVAQLVMSGLERNHHLKSLKSKTLHKMLFIFKQWATRYICLIHTRYWRKCLRTVVMSRF